MAGRGACMGCGASHADLEVAINILALAQSRGVLCTRETAIIGAKFCPGRSPSQVLEWLDDPWLDSSAALPESVAAEQFELVVPPELQGQNARIMTTIVLPSGKRIAVSPGEGRCLSETLPISVPAAALTSVNEWTLHAWTSEDEDQEARERGPVRGAHGAKRPLSLEELDDECPVISPSVRFEGDEECSVCQEYLCKAGHPVQPLRQLYAATMHARPNNSTPHACTRRSGVRACVRRVATQAMFSCIPRHLRRLVVDG